MKIPMSLPLDHDGFVRRECPKCERQFKWHSGPASEEAELHADPTEYWCPFCGSPAGPGQWFTSEQVEYARGVALPAVAQYMNDELKNAFRGLNSKHIKVTHKPSSETPAAPMPLTELDDMVIVASPCHSYEPVKVPEDEPGPFYCLICGALFAV